jgi:hypothetical protein
MNVMEKKKFISGKMEKWLIDENNEILKLNK